MPERKEKCTLLYQQLFQCYGNARLKRWIVGFVSPVVELCCTPWHTLKLSRSRVDLSLHVCVCVWWVLQQGYLLGNCVSVNVYSPLFVPYRYAANCQAGSCSFKSATKGSFPNVRSLQIHCFSSWMKQSQSCKDKAWINGGTQKRIYQLM